MKVVIAGGIYRESPQERARRQPTPEMVLEQGLTERGVDVVVRPLESRMRIATSRADIVHVHHLSRAAVAAALAPASFRCVVTPHGTAEPARSRDRWGTSAVMRFADAVVCLSSREREQRAARWPDVAPRLRVIPNGLAHPAAPPLTREWSTSNPLRVLFVGQLIKVKRVDRILEAAGALPWVTVRLVYHNHALEPLLRAQAVRLGVDGRVTFLGRLSGEALHREYAAAHVLALPSESEALPSVVTEALSTGLPVIASDVGGVSDQVRDAGVVVAPHDDEALTRALRSWPDRHAELARAAARRGEVVREEFSVPTMIDRHVALYRDLLGGLSVVRIVHVGTAGMPALSDRGGALQRRMLEMGRLQAEDGHDVLIVSSGDQDRSLEHHGVVVQELSLRTQHPYRTYEFLARCRSVLARQPPRDLLHAHGSPWAATVLGRSTGAAVQSVDYFRYGGTRRALGRRVYERALARFDATLPVSAYCAAEITRFYPALAASARVLPNGVNLDQFSADDQAAAAAARALGLPIERPLVVYLGRVCEQKGSDLLGPLARRLEREAPQAVVVAAGPAAFGRTDRSPLMRQLETDGVTCTGAVDEAHLAELLSAATVVVLPTRHDEMFGMAALEAIASGTPVVASDLGGIPEAVGAGGLLFPVADDDAFARAVVSLLIEPELRARTAAAGRLHARRFGWRTIVDSAAVIYDEVLQ